MRTGFVAALSIFAILDTGYASAYDLKDFLSAFGTTQQKADEVNSLVSQLKNVNVEKLSEVQKKQVESVKTFLSAQQDQQNILKSLKLINNAQAENLQDLEKRYPESYNIRVIVDSFNGNLKKASEEIAKFQTTQKSQNHAVKTLLTNSLAQHKNIEKNYAEIVKIFLRKSDKKTIESAINIAIKKGYTDIVRMLLALGVDPNTTDNVNGRTLLMIAAKNSEEIVPLLIEKGAKINVHDKDGYYALDYAHKGLKSENIKYLKKLGAKEKVRRRKQYK